MRRIVVGLILVVGGFAGLPTAVSAASGAPLDAGVLVRQAGPGTNDTFTFAGLFSGGGQLYVGSARGVAFLGCGHAGCASGDFRTSAANPQDLDGTCRISWPVTVTGLLGQVIALFPVPAFDNSMTVSCMLSVKETPAEPVTLYVTTVNGSYGLFRSLATPVG